MIDLSIYAGNNKKNISTATTGSIGFTLPGGVGTIASGEDYKIGAIPAGSLITNVTVVVTTAFNGTTPTGDVTIGTVVEDDLALTAGVTRTAVDKFVDVATPILFTPTLDGATTGELKVVVEFVEVNAYTATFTE